jgi:hypothetical protein
VRVFAVFDGLYVYGNCASIFWKMFLPVIGMVRTLILLAERVSGALLAFPEMKSVNLTMVALVDPSGVKV